MTSCVVVQAEQGQTLEMCKEDTQSVTERSNDTDTRFGGASVGDVEKTGQKADSVYRKQTVLQNQKRKASIYP